MRGFKHSQAVVSTASGVSTSSELISRLDNELIKDQPNPLWAPTPYIHLAFTQHHSHDEFSPGLPHFLPPFCFRELLSTETEEQKVGYSGSKANFGICNHSPWYFDNGKSEIKSVCMTSLSILEILQMDKTASEISPWCHICIRCIKDFNVYIRVSHGQIQLSCFKCRANPPRMPKTNFGWENSHIQDLCLGFVSQPPRKMKAAILIIQLESCENQFW